MSVFIISLVAFGASALTFFSGFGLGTLLLPAFALFYPVEQAIAWTAIVHFLNGLFKAGLVGRYAHWRTVLAFGLPAIGAAVLGAWLLVRLANIPPLFSYTLGGIHATVDPAKLVVGVLLLAVTAIEAAPRFASLAIPATYVPVGGLVSGFFGGLSGMQGALRSAFLIRVGLSKEAFIGTSVVVAVLIDVSRLTVYARDVAAHHAQLDFALLSAAVLSAFAGAILGNRYLKKLTVRALQRIVAVMVSAAAIGLISGLL